MQGLGAGLAPLAFALARDNVTPPRLPMAIGLLVAATAAGSAVGFVLAGLLVDHVSVSAIFWLLFAVGVLLAMLGWLAVPESPIRITAPIDLLGALLLTGAIGSLALAVSEASGSGLGLEPHGADQLPRRRVDCRVRRSRADRGHSPDRSGGSDPSIDLEREHRDGRTRLLAGGRADAGAAVGRLPQSDGLRAWTQRDPDRTSWSLRTRSESSSVASSQVG